MKEKELYKKVFEENMANKEKILRNAKCSNKNNFSFKKGFALAAILVLVVVVSLIVAASVYTEKSFDGNLKAIKSYKDVIKAVNGYYDSVNAFSSNSIGLKGAAMPEDTASNESNDKAQYDSPASPAAPIAGEDYSKTNVQTEGMDEGDIVKCDGQFIYKLNSKGFFIISATDGQLSVVTAVEIDNYVPQEMYITGNKLIIIGGIYEYRSSMPAVDIAPLYDCVYCMGFSKTDIRIYDITDKTNIVMDRQITLEGVYNTSRLQLSENKLFFIINYDFYYGREENYVPKIMDSLTGSSEMQLIPKENIFVFTHILGYNYLILGEIDLDAPSEKGKLFAYLGLGGMMYVSTDNIFVASYDYLNDYKYNVFGWAVSTDSMQKYVIVKISISDLLLKKYGYVNGTISDRYWMDEYQGYLRVATQGSNGNNLYVLNGELEVVGKIEGIAKGESIYSVRFNKDKGSMVTFLRRDPYYSFDLSDPTNPTITNEVKEDGVSHYIHYIGETGYTIGVGEMSEEVENSWGGTSVVWTGLKVSLYDNESDQAIVNLVLEGYCYSELFYNPKALLYDEEKGIFAFSYEKWTYGQYYQTQSIEQGLAVFSFDVDAQTPEEKLVYKGTLTNIDGSFRPYVDEYYDYNSTFIKRGLYIGNYLYTISDRLIKSYDLVSLLEVSSLDLYDWE